MKLPAHIVINPLVSLHAWGADHAEVAAEKSYLELSHSLNISRGASIPFWTCSDHFVTRKIVQPIASPLSTKSIDSPPPLYAWWSIPAATKYVKPYLALPDPERCWYIEEQGFMPTSGSGLRYRQNPDYIQNHCVTTQNAAKCLVQKIYYYMLKNSLLLRIPAKYDMVG